jgi:hypothetical protein
MPLNLACLPVEAAHVIVERRLHGIEVSGADAFVFRPAHRSS